MTEADVPTSALFIDSNPKFVVEIVALVLIYSLEWLFPLFKRAHSRTGHTITHIAIAMINGALGIIVFTFLIIEVIMWSAVNNIGLLHQIEIPSIAQTILAIILFDLWMYCWHRANHSLPFLWRFHRTHHSDTEMDCTTALRFHPGEIMLSFLARLLVIPLLGIWIVHLIIYESILQVIILFHHSNIALPERWDALLRAIIVTPNMHRVHHSRVLRETNSNYSSIFSIWDRLFGSFVERKDISTIDFGLDEYREKQWQSVRGLLKTPFIDDKQN